MRVFLTGGTGLIGRGLTEKLLARGDQPVVLSRQADKFRRNPKTRGIQVIQGDPAVAGGWESAVDGCDAVINLVGHNLFSDRWNAKVKQTIRDSRVYSTEHVVSAIEKSRSRPKVLVQASAIGYYGPSTSDTPQTEETPSGHDFMAVVCREWEQAAAPVADLGVRLATIRTGIVLAKGEGALGFIGPIYKLFLGSPVGGSGSPLKPGTGHQWMSWIHIDDIVGLFLTSLDNPAATGPINGVAPNPVRHAEFGKALGKALRRPFIPIGPPDFMLNLLLGEVAQVVTAGQKVLPTKAESLGYHFQYPEIAAALREIYAKKAVAETPRAPAVAHSAHH